MSAEPQASPRPRSVPRAGWAVVANKEFADHLLSIRFIVLLAILGLAVGIPIFLASEQIRTLASQVSGAPALFIALFIIGPQDVSIFQLDVTVQSFISLTAPLLGLAFAFVVLLLALVVWRWGGLRTFALLAAGIALAVGGLVLGGRRAVRSRYRPDPWALPECLTAAAGVATAAALGADLGLRVAGVGVSVLDLVALGAVVAMLGGLAVRAARNLRTLARREPAGRPRPA
jgi:hypothetical protein